MGLKKLMLAGAVLGFAGLAMGGQAIAQPISDRSEQITVSPSGPTRQPFGGSLKGGMRANIVSMQQTVGYGDLDLSKASDKVRLERRIAYAANDVCRQLDAKYPPTVYVPVEDVQNCARTATHEALMRARYDIARNEGTRYDRDDHNRFEE